MYIERAIQDKLISYLKQFKVVLVTGPRQAGKTTLLLNSLPKGYDYVTLDDMMSLDFAQRDPMGFLDKGALPIVIDEVQQAPDLFRQAKYVVDGIEEYGMVILTGSQTYQLMAGVSESLAGRVGILELPTLSLREVIGINGRGPYIPSKVDSKRKHMSADFDIWECIHRGSMPRLQDKEVNWQDYYSSYVRSYLERDVRQLLKLKDERKFYNFMVACAARTGQLFNATDIAGVVGVDVKTVQGWVSVLNASGIIHMLQPFWANEKKRLSKTPKIYFMDTGLATYLTSWNTPEQLKRGAFAGHIFETFVVSEVLKSYMNAGRSTYDISFYRDDRKREIDLVIQEGHVLHPVEVKMAVQVGGDAVKNFGCLEGFSDFEMGFGSVICQTKNPYMVSEQVQAVSPLMI